MKKMLYFFYFIKTTNYTKLVQSLKETRETKNISYTMILLDMIISSFKYKSSLNDYFLYEFYNKNHEQRSQYFTTGKSYEFYTKMNNKRMTDNFRNKLKFNNTFQKFINRSFLYVSECSIDDFYSWIIGKDYIIAKPSNGASGKGIEKIYVEKYKEPTELYIYLKENKLELVEEFIQQHQKMNEINPSCVNTMRIITVRWRDKIDIISAFLRIGIDEHIDNFSAGGIAASIDVKTGLVSGPGVSKQSNVTYEYHPRTKSTIKGFEIPYWQETVKMIHEAAEIVPEVRTVGWDVAITESGPELIEGNDNWGKDAFQLANQKGQGYLFDEYK